MLNPTDASGDQNARPERRDDKKPDLGVAFRNSLIATILVATPIVALLINVFEDGGKYLLAAASALVLGLMYFFLDLFLRFGKRKD